jgi:molybdate-binding protein
LPPPAAGQPLAVARVGKRLVAHALTPAPAYLPAAQAIATEDGAALVLDEAVDSRVLIAGCDPALSLLARHALAAGVAVSLVPANSAQSLRWLRSGHTHLAGCHLADEAGGMNLDAVQRELGRTAAAVVTFAGWEEGFVVGAGNPKSIRTAADLARRNIKLINRESGAGARSLLDRHLQQAGLPADRVQGYEETAPGHLAAAWQVAAGWADVCVAPLAAARAFGLSFVPLASERFDLVMRKEHLMLPGVSRLLDILNRAALRQELSAFAGYDVSATGGRIR